MSLRWQQHQYGTGYTATLTRGFDLQVIFESNLRLPAGTPAYNVYVFGQRLKLRSPDIEDGKRRAVIAARQMLADLAAKLD